MEWETVIGLEVHTQLACQSKIFSSASTAYGAEPNTQACPVDLGLPGVLPVLNEQAVNYAIQFGLAVDGQIDSHCVFARKNYFYPDLPKGYQISQFAHPIVGKGHLDIALPKDQIKRIGITRAHLEEDAGKSIHDAYPGASGIDLNRAGTPLLEIVSEPDMRNATEAVTYLKTLHQLVRYLGISDGNMQEGSFRCDVNISLRRPGETALGTRAEIKNLNSFRFVQQAIEVEQARQAERLEAGLEVVQETRLYDPERQETRSMRSKEEAFDYRYFPDPDLLPVYLSPDRIETQRQLLPELPTARKKRFIDELSLSEQDAHTLSMKKDMADYFESTLSSADQRVPPKLVANWVIGAMSAQLKQSQQRIDDSPVSASQLAELLSFIVDDSISSSSAKKVFDLMWDTQESAADIIEKHGLRQVSDLGEMEAILDNIIAQNPEQVSEFKAGKTKLMAFFVGQMMKATQGKANPKLVTDLIRKKLQN